MGIKIVKPNKRVGLAEVESLQAALKEQLPDDYRNFLLDFNGGRPEENVCTLTSGSDVGVDFFFGALGKSQHYDLLHARNRMIDRVPQKLLPIADAAGGDLILLSLRPDCFGCVFFWDHEREAEEGQPATFDNVVKIDNSFHEFIENLRQPEPIELRPGQVKRVWIDPDFLAELNAAKKKKE